MGCKSFPFWFSFIFFYIGLANVRLLVSSHDTAIFNRSSFPPGFIFGTATSAYQYEGGAKEGGRGPSIWDTFTHKHPEKIKDRSTGDVAIDGYHRYEEDVMLMKDMNADAYRFSICWSRLLPNGKLSGGVNKEGIDYYNNLINKLLDNGIEPFVTLFHWDLPQGLEDEYGGFMSPQIVEDFRDYADVCFKEFGDRVRYWITLNEPWAYSVGGYASGFLILAPGRCSEWQKLNCSGGDSSTEPYIVAHNQILAHAVAVHLFRQKYQEKQKGKIGITVVSHWLEPATDSIQDQEAAERSLEFILGWFMEPMTYGDYPQSMKTLVGNRLPQFTKRESDLITASFDFIGLNYYAAFFASDLPLEEIPYPSVVNDYRAKVSGEYNGVQIGPQTVTGWLYVYPEGFEKLLLYTKTKYNNPVIYITENGVDEFYDDKLSLEEALIDHERIDYFYQHLLAVNNAIKKGVNVKGYFAWSFVDNFEWNSGYTIRFGIHYIDYKNGLKRYPKLSAGWFKNFLKRENQDMVCLALVEPEGSAQACK